MNGNKHVKEFFHEKTSHFISVYLLNNGLIALFIYNFRWESMYILAPLAVVLFWRLCKSGNMRDYFNFEAAGFIIFIMTLVYIAFDAVQSKRYYLAIIYGSLVGIPGISGFLSDALVCMYGDGKVKWNSNCQENAEMLNSGKMDKPANKI